MKEIFFAADIDIIWATIDAGDLIRISEYWIVCVLLTLTAADKFCVVTKLYTYFGYVMQLDKEVII